MLDNDDDGDDSDMPDDPWHNMDWLESVSNNDKNNNKDNSNSNNNYKTTTTNMPDALRFDMYSMCKAVFSFVPT